MQRAKRMGSGGGAGRTKRMGSGGELEGNHSFPGKALHSPAGVHSGGRSQPPEPAVYQARMSAPDGSDSAAGPSTGPPTPGTPSTERAAISSAITGAGEAVATAGNAHAAALQSAAEKKAAALQSAAGTKAAGQERVAKLQLEAQAEEQGKQRKWKFGSDVLGAAAGAQYRCLPSF